MDKNHQLDAPDNEELSSIKQLENHSELSSLYPHPHAEWEGTELLSHMEREQKRDDAQRRITTSIRKWFPVIGLVSTAPVVITALTFVLAYRFLSHADKLAMLLPVLALVTLVAWACYRCIKTVYIIFYNHAMSATLFMYSLGLSLALSVAGIFALTEPFLSGDYVIDALILCGAFMSLGIIYSGVLIFLWSSQRISGKAKLWSITGILACLLASTLYILLT